MRAGALASLSTMLKITNLPISTTGLHSHERRGVCVNVRGKGEAQERRRRGRGRGEAEAEERSREMGAEPNTCTA